MVQLQILYFLRRSYITTKNTIPDSYIVCLPQNVASAAAFKIHNLYGFHFSSYHMLQKMRKLIYSPGLESLVLDIVRTCPVCTLSPTKKLYRECGEVRSTVYAPLQAVIMDSVYLPADRLAEL